MENLNLVVQRERTADKVVIGTLTVNGQVVGKTYENSVLMVPAGLYKGNIRYVSGHNFVPGPFGTVAHAGDFLLEIGNAPGGNEILFHSGNKPKPPKGSILLGTVGKDPKRSAASLEYDHSLRKLRRLFYGTDMPLASPAKNATIRVSDIDILYN
jgi:Family of unknown function (DUF5675)